MSNVIEIPDAIREAVARGAKYLDVYTDPGVLWYWRIDLEILQMRFGCNCVVGQLYHGDWARGSYKLRLPQAYGHTRGWQGKTVDLGFHARNHQEWDALTEAWRQLILKRRS